MEPICHLWLEAPSYYRKNKKKETHLFHGKKNTVDDKTKINMREFKYSAFALGGGHKPGKVSYDGQEYE